MKRLYLILFCSLAIGTSFAQQANKYPDKDYARNPVWVKMIGDTTANYFETQKAFNTYFQHHEKPGGEDDVIGEKKERDKHPSKRKLRELANENDLRIQVKKYERWLQRMRPYVQPDGRILTPTERLVIYKSQKQ